MLLRYFFVLWTFLFLGTDILRVKCQECDRKACFPSTGELVLGRSDKITATSTCGLNGAQTYCKVTELTSAKKCFTCDSRPGASKDQSHLVTNIAPSSDGNRTWWQSENAVEKVTIQIDFEAEFRLSHLIMTFATFRPAGMILKKSRNFGRTWESYQYFAENCPLTFPAVSMTKRANYSHVICIQGNSQNNPESGAKLTFIAIPDGTTNYDRLDPLVLDWIAFTNIRLEFVKLQTFHETIGLSNPDANEKYYYAISELQIFGSCLCYGHASRCIPHPSMSNTTLNIQGMVHGKCDCKHSTFGHQCQVCLPEYNDQPWIVGYKEGKGCTGCKCNNHASTCKFLPQIYIKSNNVSGSQCLQCQHNTAGDQCNTCADNHYRNINEPLASSNVCIGCNCDARGTTEQTCNKNNGDCICKQNVMGITCDQCKKNFFGLNSNDSLGCQPCNCYSDGVVSSSTCDSDTGQCKCLTDVDGTKCERCRDTLWGLTSQYKNCMPCNCQPGGSYKDTCNDNNGQCLCRKHLSGSHCNQVADSYYFTTMDSILFEAEDPSVTDINRNSSILEVNRFLGYSYELFTGSGYRVMESQGIIQATISVPRRFNYSVLVRFEPLPVLQNITLTVNVKSPASGTPVNCDIPSIPILLKSTSTEGTYLSDGICLGEGKHYTIDIQYINNKRADLPLKLDSIVMWPSLTSVASVELSQTPSKTLASHEAQDCAKLFYKPYNITNLADNCTELMFTMSTILNDGALACDCNPSGTISNTTCDKIAGQCRCKNNVYGRKCDKCLFGTYGFGLPDGCRECKCNHNGSTNYESCDPNTGQCSCKDRIYGLKCDYCQYYYYGFPNCKRCECFGHSASCDPASGFCLNCLHNTEGINCEKCRPGFIGTATKGTSNDCQRCQCPGGSSGNQFSSSCRYKISHSSTVIVCDNCTTGYAGDNCDECAPGYYGSPTSIGGKCRPCQCNNNIDPNQKGNCNNQNGDCLKCLYDTYGSKCDLCKPGYYGDAVARTCKRCQCNKLGSFSDICDSASGQCICRRNVTGRTCHQCEKSFWNIESRNGCEKCNCCSNSSIDASCNQTTGRCTCIKGYSGDKCCQCEDEFWGDPSVRCHACNCNKRGSSSSQCDRKTGQCRCIASAGGILCDTCARGYVGSFPNCTRCHVCFTDWDNRIKQFKIEASKDIDMAQNLLTNGSYLTSFEGLRELEIGMAAIERLLANKQTTMQRLNVLHMSLIALNNSLNLYEQRSENVILTLRTVEQQLSNTNANLSKSERDLRKQDDQVDQKRNEFINQTESFLNGALASLNYSAQVIGNLRDRIEMAAERLKLAAIKVKENRQRLTNIQLLQGKDWQTIRALQQEMLQLQNTVANISGLLCGITSTDCNSTCGGLGCSSCNTDILGCNGAVGLASRSNEISNKNTVNLVEKLRVLILALENRHDLSQRANATSSAISIYIDQLAVIAQTWSIAYNNISKVTDRVAEFLSKPRPNSDNIDRLNERILTIELALNMNEIEQVSNQLNITSQVLQGNTNQNSSLSSMFSVIQDKLTSLWISMQNATKLTTELQDKFENYTISRIDAINNLANLWGVIQRSNSTVNQIEDLINQMNISMNKSLLAVNEMNETADFMLTEQPNVRNITEVANSTVNSVASLMNATNHNLTDVVEKHNNISARKNDSIPKVKSSSDKVRQLLLMVTSIREATIEKLKEVIALQEDTLRQEQKLQDYSDETMKMEEKTQEAIRDYKTAYENCYKKAVAESGGIQ